MEQPQNAEIQIILRMRKLSSKPLYYLYILQYLMILLADSEGID